MGTMIDDMRKQDAAREADARSRGLDACEVAAGRGAWKSFINEFERRLGAWAGGRKIGTATLTDLQVAGARILGELTAGLHAKLVGKVTSGDAPLVIRNVDDGDLAVGAQLSEGKARVARGTDAVCGEAWLRRYLREALQGRRVELCWHLRPSGAAARSPAAVKLRRGEKAYRVIADGAVVLQTRKGDERRRLSRGEKFASTPSLMEGAVAEGVVELVKDGEE